MSLTNPAETSSSILSFFKVEKLKLDFQPNNFINLSSSLTVPEFMNVNISILPFSAVLFSATGEKFVECSCSELSISGREQQHISPSFGFHLSDTLQSADSMGELIRDIVNTGRGLVSIGRIAFKGPSSDLAGLNRLFEIIKVNIPLEKIFGSSSQSTAGTPLLDLELLNAAFSVSENSISAKTNWQLISLIPLEANLPFLAIRMGLDDVDAAELFIPNIATKLGLTSIVNQISLLFSTNSLLPGKIASAFNSLRGSSTGIEAVFQGIQFGPSKELSYTLFNRINLHVPIHLQFNSGPSNLFHFKLPQAVKDFGLNTIRPRINKMDISVAPQSSCVLAADISFINSLPFTLDLSFSSLL